MPTRATAKKQQKDLFEKKQTPREKRIALVKAYRQKLAIGAKFYAQADELLEQILAKMKPGTRVKIGDGLWAVVVDRFEDGNKVWQPVATKRFELQIQDASGKAVRMRDSRRKKKAA